MLWQGQGPNAVVRLKATPCEVGGRCVVRGMRWQHGAASLRCGWIAVACAAWTGVALWTVTSSAQAPASPVAALPELLQPLAPPWSLSPQWRQVGLPTKKGAVAQTRFEPAAVDGQAGVKLLTATSYGTLVHTNATPATSPPGRLRWRWRLDQPLSGGTSVPDVMSKSGDDAAVKVCVMFEHPLARVPFVERTVLRLARSVSGENLPAATVCYLWDSTRPAPFRGANPYSRRVRFISLRGQGDPLQQWVDESRDVAQDFTELFADELPQDPNARAAPRINAVLVGADSDNTQSRSQAWVAELRWDAAPP